MQREPPESIPVYLHSAEYTTRLTGALIPNPARCFARYEQRASETSRRRPGKGVGRLVGNHDANSSKNERVLQGAEEHMRDLEVDVRAYCAGAAAAARGSQSDPAEAVSVHRIERRVAAHSSRVPLTDTALSASCSILGRGCW